MISGLPRPATTGSASVAPAGELAHQRQRIDLALQRHEARHDRAGLDRESETAARDRLGRGSMRLN
jgi:hypothetical protein